MNFQFARTLRELREERGLSQKQLGQQMFVNHSTIARWENATRLPDASMILRLADCLGVEAVQLLRLVAQSEENPEVILVDDCKVIMTEEVSVLKDVMPMATITGFVWPMEAIEYVKKKQVLLAFLDIEMGTANGLELCHTLHEINPYINIVFLTAYPDYSIDAWKTEASGFMLKPLTAVDVKDQLKRLRYPIQAGGVCL